MGGTQRIFQTDEGGIAEVGVVATTTLGIEMVAGHHGSYLTRQGKMGGYCPVASNGKAGSWMPAVVCP